MNKNVILMAIKIIISHKYNENNVKIKKRLLEDREVFICPVNMTGFISLLYA